MKEINVLKKVNMWGVLLITFMLMMPHILASSGIGVYIDGKVVQGVDSTRVDNGRVLVPLKGIFKAINMDVQWEPTTKMIISNGQGRTIVLQVGKQQAKVNGETINLDVPAKIINGETFVPLRFIGESIGMDVSWDSSAKKVSISTKGIELFDSLGRIWYRGEVNDKAEPHGYGLEYAKTGELIYTGEWENGVKEGRGTFTWKNKSTYTGMVKNNEPHGQGELYHFNEGTYKGEFNEGKRYGQGSFIWKNGDEYIGRWENDKMNGKGVYTFAHGMCYAAEFKDNKMVEVLNKYKKN